MNGHLPPRILTDPTTEEVLGIGGFVIAGSVLLDRGFHAEDDEDKAYTMLASGASILVGLWLLSRACGRSRKGFCQMATGW